MAFRALHIAADHHGFSGDLACPTLRFTDQGARDATPSLLWSNDESSDLNAKTRFHDVRGVSLEPSYDNLVSIQRDDHQIILGSANRAQAFRDQRRFSAISQTCGKLSHRLCVH